MSLIKVHNILQSKTKDTIDIMGDMADYYSNLDDYPDDHTYEPQPKTCRACGKKNLHWEQRKVHALHPPVWRLCDGRGIHHCKVNPPPEDNICAFKPTTIQRTNSPNK